MVKCLKSQKIFYLKNVTTNNGDMLLILFMIFLKCLNFLLIFLLIFGLSVKKLKKNNIFLSQKDTLDYFNKNIKNYVNNSNENKIFYFFKEKKYWLLGRFRI